MKFRGHSPRTICYGRPRSSVDRGREGVEARPYGGLRGLTDYVIAPHQRRPQPLSHGAKRRDSSPFRGAEGWAEVCGVYASAYHDADTYVSLTPVRGGVLDAPWLRNCRGEVGASARPDQPHPRHPRCARFRPPPNICNPAGTARAPFCTGAPTLSVHPRRAGVEDKPLRWVGCVQPPSSVIPVFFPS